MVDDGPLPEPWASRPLLILFASPANWDARGGRDARGSAAGLSETEN